MSGSGKGGGIILFASWRRVGADRERQLAPDDRGSSPRSWRSGRPGVGSFQGLGQLPGGAHSSSMAWKGWRGHVAGWWWAVGVYYPPPPLPVALGESADVPSGLAIQLDGFPGVWALFVVDEDAVATGGPGWPSFPGAFQRQPASCPSTPCSVPPRLRPARVPSPGRAELRLWSGSFCRPGISALVLASTGTSTAAAARTSAAPSTARRCRTTTRTFRLMQLGRFAYCV